MTMTAIIRVWVLLLAIAGSAFADGAENRKLAERHFRAGEKAYAAQNFEAASANFEEAYKVLPLPEIAFSAAQAHRRQYRIDPKLEHAKRAVELYRAYLDKVKTGGRVGVAADSLGEMQREVDKLTAAGQKAAAASAIERTRLGVSPVLGAEKKQGGMREIADLPDESATKIVATIDGKPVPPFQLMDVTPGTHTLRVEADGYITKVQTERVVKGSSNVVELALEPKPARVTIATEKGARVRIDGRPIGTAPLATFEVPAGKHIVTIAHAGREGVARELDVSRGEEIKIEQPLQKTSRRRAVPFVLVGASVVGVIALTGLVGTIALDRQADDKLAAIERGDQRPEVANDYNDLTRQRGDLLTGTLITGGIALVAVGAAGALYWLDRPSEEGIRVTPSGTGVSVSGRF